MNINDYRKAMEHINPNNELKERIIYKKPSQKRYAPVRHILASTLTAALILTCVTTAALTASPELRTAVLSFFHIDEPKKMPGQPETNQPNASQREIPGQLGNSQDEDPTQLGNSQGENPGHPGISQTEIGNLVKAQYIEMDQLYNLYGELFNNLTWSDDHRTLLDFKFLEIKDGNLIPVQVDMQTNQIDVTFQNIHYQGSLYWFIWNGKLYHFQSSPYPPDMLPEDGWSVEAIPGRTDVLLLKLTWGRPDYTEYPMLYYLDTGETEDFLAGTDADQLEYAYNWLWSENMRRALILCSTDADGPEEWLCDLDTKTLTRLDDLTGLDKEANAIFADNDTLILTIPTTVEGDETWQTVTCYAYDIPTGQKTKTLDETHCYQWWEWWDEAYGAQLCGSYCILINHSGQIQLVDLKTGTQTAVEGFTYQVRCGFILNGDKQVGFPKVEGSNHDLADVFLRSPSGNKLLYYSFDSEVEDSSIPQLSVVDLEKGTSIAFDREGYENFHVKELGWIDDSRVIIIARSLDDETLYLILYTF